MFTRIGFFVLALLASFGARAQEAATNIAVLEAGEVRQLNTTQAHLREIHPPDDVPRKGNAPLVARLVGKMLSAQVKGLNIELKEEAEPSAAALQNPASSLRFNRRAEICYDNYRVGFKRGGVAMRYEMSF